MIGKNLTMGMSMTFARRRRSKLIRTSLLLGILSSSVTCWAQGGSAALSQRLYLLAGTTTQHTPDSYPVVLYRIGENKKLELAREVVAESESIRFVYAWGNVVFALHPHSRPTSAAIVHTDDPLRTDDVTFSPEGAVPSPSATVVAAPPGGPLVLLVPWITNLSDPAHPPEHYNVTLARISSSSESVPRLQWNTWSDYAYLRYEGATGGPNYDPGVIGFAVAENLTVRMFDHSAVIDKLPPRLRGTNPRITPFIVAASRDYLILTPQYSWEAIRSGKLGDSLELYVRDRLKDHWSTVQSDGNSPTLRLFGPWLATIVGLRSPDHGPPPGRENERTEAEKTDRLPPVQTLYHSFAGRDILLPGLLTLKNLADGRKIQIETGQEDSEILKVEGDVVLYRVNDTIYQARIDGSQLKDTTIVVKDEDVPEVHWVFWSK
jgi:hypothetical protein